jgi:hypothetical protein
VRAPAAAAAVSAGGGQAGGVVDPDEPKSMQKMRQKLQELRVDSLRAGMRLGYAATSEQLQQWLSVLERIEKVNAPPLRRRVDVNRLALAEATVRNRLQRLLTMSTGGRRGRLLPCAGQGRHQRAGGRTLPC